MLDFDFISPTKLYFGKGKEEKISEICRDFGFKRVFVVVGTGSAKKSGLLDKVLSKLSENQIEFYVFEGIRANPTIEKCREGISKAREFKPDLLLAIGGGSVIDTAKNISVGYFYDGDSFDFHLKKAIPTKALPVGVILTIAASGSELSDSCVVQNDETHTKSGFNNDIVRPVFDIENPELTYSLPKEQTYYGVVDILMHTLERYVQLSSEIEPADGFAETVIKNTLFAGVKLLDNPKDYESRAVLMLMSSYSHNGLTSLGKYKFMPVHKFEHVLSAIYPSVAHGAGLALIYPTWARYYVNEDKDKFAKLARNVFGSTETDDLVAANFAIDELEKYFDKFGMPMSYADLGIKDVDVDYLARKLTNEGKSEVFHHSKPANLDIAREIYNNIRRR